MRRRRVVVVVVVVGSRRRGVSATKCLSDGSSSSAGERIVHIRVVVVVRIGQECSAAMTSLIELLQLANQTEDSNQKN